MNIRYWLDRATKEIRFTPDRKAVREELLAHYEDRLEALLARGMSEKEAAQSAVEAMGDPADIAAELGRIHTPWWGYLWRASRVAVVLAAMILALHLPEALSRSGILRNYFTPLELAVGDTITYAYGRVSTVLAVWAPEGSAVLDSYRLTVPQVYLEHADAFTTPDGTTLGEQCTLYIYLRSSTWRLWEPSDRSQDMILRNMVTDSSGRQYARSEYFPDAHAPLALFCQTYQGVPGVTWYRVELELPSPGAVPDWVDIPVGYGGETVRVDLKEEVVDR